MTSRRAFVVAFVTLSTVVAGAVASIRTPAAGAGDHGVRRDRRVHAAAGAPQAQSLPKQPVETPVAVRPPVLLVRPDDDAPSTPLVLEQARYDVTVTGLARAPARRWCFAMTSAASSMASSCSRCRKAPWSRGLRSTSTAA